MKLLRLCAFVLLLTSPLLADSINGFVVESRQIVYLGDPNLVVRPWLDNDFLFGTTFPNTFRGTITVTFSIFGESFVTSTDVTTPALGLYVPFAFPQGDYTHPVPATLTFDLFNQPEHQYNFLVAPVPEPGTLVFVCTGLAALMCRKFVVLRN